MKCNALRSFVRKKEYLTWPEDPQDMEWFYDRLISNILKDIKVKKVKEDQAESEGPEVQPDGVRVDGARETAM